MNDQPAAAIEYGVTPTDVMASMAGVDFVRAPAASGVAALPMGGFAAAGYAPFPD